MMKTTKIIITGLICTVILTCGALQAQQESDLEEQPVQVDDSTPLFPIFQHGLFGFIDRTGKVVIEPQFAHAAAFSEGLAPVLIGGEATGKYGFIDKTGEVVIEPQFEFALSFSEGLAPVRIGDYWGAIDMTGKVAISPQFVSIRPFSNGLALVWTGDKHVYIDKAGDVAIDGKFDEAESFSEGLAAVVIYDGKTKRWAYIDTTGNIAISTHSDTASCFSEGLAAVGTQDETGWLSYMDKSFANSTSKGPTGTGTAEAGKLGYIDKTGKVVIIHRFDWASPFSEGLAAVRVGDRIDGKYGFIDKTGNMVIAPRFDGASYFSEGLAAVRIGDKCGYIDETGEYAISLQFYDATRFSGGLAEVRIDSWETGRYVYIDKEGEIVWGLNIEPSSEDIYRFMLFTILRYIIEFFGQAFGNTTTSLP